MKQFVKFLVEYGCDVDIKNNYEYTALHFASIKGHIDIVKYLI